jgi:hypothetical protein
MEHARLTGLAQSTGRKSEVADLVFVGYAPARDAPSPASEATSEEMAEATLALRKPEGQQNLRALT